MPEVSPSRITTQCRRLAIATCLLATTALTMSVSAPSAGAADGRAAARGWTTVSPAPPVMRPSKTRTRGALRARPLARASAPITAGYAYCGFGKIVMEPPAVAANPYQLDYVRWRGVVYTWLGSSWSGPSVSPWSGWQAVDRFGTKLPPAQTPVRSGRYYSVQYQAEHYYAGQTFNAAPTSHFNQNGFNAGSSDFCWVA